jgi:hypothetical protein
MENSLFLQKFFLFFENILKNQTRQVENADQAETLGACFLWHGLCKRITMTFLLTLWGTMAIWILTGLILAARGSAPKSNLLT